MCFASLEEWWLLGHVACSHGNATTIHHPTQQSLTPPKPKPITLSRGTLSDASGVCALWVDGGFRFTVVGYARICVNSNSKLYDNLYKFTPSHSCLCDFVIQRSENRIVKRELQRTSVGRVHVRISYDRIAMALAFAWIIETRKCLKGSNNWAHLNFKNLQGFIGHISRYICQRVVFNCTKIGKNGAPITGNKWKY